MPCMEFSYILLVIVNAVSFAHIEMLNLFITMCVRQIKLRARSLSRYFSLVTIERGFSALLCSGDFCYLLCTITILCHIAREC